MELKSKTTKKILAGSNKLILILSLLGIIVVINFFFSRHFTRFDLTEKKEFSISPATKSILAGLDDIVTVKAYFSSKLPPYIANLSDQVRDMLEEFTAYSKGNLRFEFIDPGSDPQTQQKMRFEGIPQAQLAVIQKDKREIMKVYLGISIHYADKKEVIPVVQNTNNLEYELASRLMKLTSKELKTVGIYSSIDENTMKTKFKTLQETLQKQYNVETVKLTDGKMVDDKVNTLIVISPNNCSETVKYALDQFLMKGGRIIILNDVMKLAQRSLQGEDVKSNLGDLLQHYGLKVENGLAVDLRNNEIGAFSMGYITYQTNYPFWPKILKTNFDKKNPAVSDLEALALPWTAPVDILTKDSKDITATVLAKSSEYAFLQKSPYNLNPQQKYTPSKDEMKSLPLVVSLSGKFNSFFEGKEIPAGIGKKDKDKSEKPKMLTKSPKTQIVLIGSSHFIEDSFIGMVRSGRSNVTFMSNIVDWLTLGNKLISIRSRKVTERPLKELSESSKSFIRFINIFAISLIVIFIGLIRLFIRRKSQKMFEHYYN